MRVPQVLKWIVLAALFAAMPVVVAFAQQPAAATVTIHADRPGPKIDKHIYGQFAEHLGTSIYEGIWVGEKSSIPNMRGYRNDVLAALKRLRISNIRWPGGCFADAYDWRDGIGPRAQRPERINIHWGRAREDNSFGTHEFMDLTELLGAEAYVAGNMGSDSPREMLHWLEYMTADGQSALAKERRANGRDKPWKVKFFGVGNESWGCGGNMRPEYSADLHRRYVTYVRVPRGEPPVRVATGANRDDFRFTEVLMRDAARHMDALSLHYYTHPTGDGRRKGPSTGFTEAEWAATLSEARKIDDLIARHSAIMDKYDPDKRVTLAVDEWGTWYDAEPGREPDFLWQQNTVRDAQVAALHFNIFHRHADRVRIANIAQMVNVLQAMILTDGPKMLLTPTYHVFEMYIPFQDATFLPAEVDTPDYRSGNVTLPAVDVSAARGADGAIHLALVNSDPNKPARISTKIAGVNARGATGRLLTGDAMDARNTFEQPETVRPVPFSGNAGEGGLVFALPPMSVAVVKVQQ